MSTIILRTVKGLPLTSAEVDANFDNLNRDKIERTVLVNDTSPALKITQTGAGHALLVEDSNPDSTPTVITADGRLGVGTSTPSYIIESSDDVLLNGARIGKGAGLIATNLVVGGSALAANTTGTNNTAIGHFSLAASQTGNFNTAVGFESLYSNTTFNHSTAVGYRALRLSTAVNNTAIGSQAGDAITTGADNTAVGFDSLGAVNTGTQNTSVGSGALATISTVSGDTAIGYKALAVSTSSQNVAVGAQAGVLATTGAGLTLIGENAGSALTTASKHTLIGRYTGNSGGLDIRTLTNYVVLSDGDGNIRWLANNSGNVLIGTVTDNTYRLNLVNTGNELISARSSGGARSLQVKSGTDAIELNAQSDAGTTGILALKRDNTEVARCTVANNFLIGRTTESTNGKLVVKGNTGNGTNASFLSSNVDQGIDILSGYKLEGSASATRDDTISTIRSTNGGLAFGSSNTEYARLNSNGNFVVGSVSDIGWKTNINSSNNQTQLAVTNAGASNDANLLLGMSTSVHTTFRHERATNDLAVIKSATERARLLDAGYFKVSAAGSYDAVAGTYHEFSSSAATTTFMVRNTNTSSAVNNIYSQMPTSAAGNHIVAFISGGAVFRVSANGNVANTNNSYGAISDIKLKEAITDVSPKLDKINQVRVVNYKLKADQSGQELIGVIAQELEEVFPSLVEETPDYVYEDGQQIATGETTKSVKYSVFIPLLIKAVQELSAQNEELKSRIEALEGSGE